MVADHSPERKNCPRRVQLETNRGIISGIGPPESRFPAGK